jgi:plasmid stabilization system protein ParE
MADDRPDMEFEDIPLEDARRMGRGPRMEPLLYDTLRTKIQALSTEATRIRLRPEIRPDRMKNYLLRIAQELNVPVTVRKIPGGVVFWRATEEDQEQAQAVSQRLRGTKPTPQAPRRGRPRRVS